MLPKSVICAAMLNYEELQILELFKNTLPSRLYWVYSPPILPSRLYWVLFPTDNLRDAIARAKRVLTKEKIDKQMTGQASSTPFMGVSDGNQSYSRASKRGVLHENSYGLDDVKKDDKLETDKYLVQTRSQTKSSGVIIPKVHGIDKGLNLHMKPEHQNLATPSTCQKQPIDKGLPMTLYHLFPSPELDKEELDLEEKQG